MNRLNVLVAREYGSYTPLSRTSFERRLAEFATWLRPDELHTLAALEAERQEAARIGARTSTQRAGARVPLATFASGPRPS